MAIPTFVLLGNVGIAVYRSGRNVIMYRNNSTPQSKQFTTIGHIHTQSIASEGPLMPNQTDVVEKSLSIDTQK